MAKSYALTEEPDPADFTEGRYYLLVTQWHAEQIGSGYVPESVKAQARLLLDYANQDELRANRPIQKKPKVVK